MKPVRIRIKMMDELSLKEAAMGKGSLGLQSIEDDEFVFLLEGKTPEIIKGLEIRGVGYEIEDEKEAGKQKSRVHTTSVQNSYGVPKGLGKVSSCFFKIVDPFSLEEEVIDSWSQVQAKLNDLGAVAPSLVQTQQVSFYESNVGKVMVEKVLVEVSTAEQEVEEDEFVDEVVFPDEKETFVFANKETYSPLKLMREGRYLGDLFLESVQAGGEEDLGFVVEEVLIESIKENYVRGKVRGKVVDSRMVENRVLTEADFEGFLEKGVYFLNNTEEENQVIEDELKMHDEESDLREKYEEGAGSADFSAVTKDGKYFLPITPDGVDLSKINWEKSTLEDPYWKKKYAKWESPASLTRYKGEVRVVVSSVEEEGFEIIASYGSPKKGRFSTFLHRRGLTEEQLKKELSKFGIEDWSAVKESSEKMVKFECEDCGGKFQAAEFLSNRSVKCPHCGGHNTSEFRQMRDLQRIGLSESRRKNFKEAANSKTTDKPSNLRSLNSWLHAHGVPASVEVVKSPQGYFFSGKGTSGWPVSNVGVYRVSHLSYGGWLSEYHELDEGTKPITESRRPVTEDSEDIYFQFLKKLADATGFEIGGGGAGVPYVEAPVIDAGVMIFGIGDEDKLGWNLINPENMEIFDDDEMQEEYTEYTFQELVDFVVSAVEENAGEEEGFEDEPDEDSITTKDHEHWYQYGKLYFTGSPKELRAKMDEDQFWPNVFFISDHGNAHVITEFTESRRVTEARLSPDQTQAIAQEIADLCKKLGWKYDVRSGGDVLTITKEFTPGDRDGFVQADGEYYDILSLLPTSSPGSTWGTDGSGIGALSAIKNGLFRMNKSGSNKTVLKKLQKLVQGKTVTESRKPCSRKRSLKESTTTEVSTKYSDPRKAAEDIVRQLKQDPVWGKELSDVQVIEGENGEVLIAMEVAFDAASGFVDGTGIFGYEGFGEMGPVFDRESSRVHLEPYDSVSLQVFGESRRRRSVKESVSDNSAYVKWMDSKGKLHLKKFEADPLEPNRAARNRASEYMRKNLKDNPDVKQHWIGLYRDLDKSEKSLKEARAVTTNTLKSAVGNLYLDGDEAAEIRPFVGKRQEINMAGNWFYIELRQPSGSGPDQITFKVETYADVFSNERDFGILGRRVLDKWLRDKGVTSLKLEESFKESEESDEAETPEDLLFYNVTKRLYELYPDTLDSLGVTNYEYGPNYLTLELHNDRHIVQGRIRVFGDGTVDSVVKRSVDEALVKNAEEDVRKVVQGFLGKKESRRRPVTESTRRYDGVSVISPGTVLGGGRFGQFRVEVVEDLGEELRIKAANKGRPEGEFVRSKDSYKGWFLKESCRGRKILEAKDTPLRELYGIPDEVRMPARVVARVRKEISKALSESYYEEIPIQEIDDVLRKHGYLLIQDDYTPWGGLLIGANAMAFLRIGQIEGAVETQYSEEKAYPQVSNTGIQMTWYKMPSGKYEIVAYLT